ncbi:TPA: hypothetical protein ACOEAL_004511, partial [Enterobacter ludwigii]
MLNKSSLRLGVIAVSVATAFGSYASVQDVTETVKGRPATVSNVTIKNKSAENLNPAQGDTLEATYTYTDPDGIPEDTNQSAYRWLADGTAAGEAVGDNTFVPGSSVLNKFLQVQITAAESAPSDPDKAAMVESSQTNAPVLPSRTEFNSLYHFSSGANMRWGDAYMYCANRNERLMSLSELQDLYINYTRATSAPAAENNSDLNQTYGVGLSTVAWSTQGGDTNHSYAYIQSNGSTASNLNSNTYEVVCAKFGPPELLPSVSIIDITGSGIPGQTLEARYIYRGNTTIPDLSTFEWFRNDTNNTDGRMPIVGATGKTYTLTSEDGGKYISVDITPASYDTVKGIKVTATKNEQILGQELISDVTILKPSQGRPFFEVNYTYNSDAAPEEGTSYQWYWKGEKIVGNKGTGKTFAFASETYPSSTQTEELRVEIIPRSSSGMVGLPKTGTLGLRSPIKWYISGRAPTWYEASKFCATTNLDGRNRPATLSELQSIVTDLGNIRAYGFQNYGSVSYGAWTGTSTSGLAHNKVNLENGTAVSDSNDSTGTEFCVAGSVVSPTPDLVVNGYYHAFNSGFPSTGFNGAKFVINDGYIDVVSSNPSVVEATPNGDVTLKGKGSATLEVWDAAGGVPSILVINPTKWFKDANMARDLVQAARACGDKYYNGQGNSAYLPTLDTLTPAKPGQSNPSRGIGTLWGEWGDLNKLGWS